jgi:hypothetical protein
MCLALAVGRGDSPLAVLRGDKPLVRPSMWRSLAAVTRWEVGAYGQAALGPSGILDIPHAALREIGIGTAAEGTLRHASDVGFWTTSGFQERPARLTGSCSNSSTTCPVRVA